MVRYLFVSCRTNFFYQKSWLFNTTLRRRLEVKPYNKESFISKGNQQIINRARSWQSPTYLVCCGWLHDVPPTLFILPQIQWVANLHLAGPASCRFVQMCLNHCKFINSLANEVMSLPMNRIPSKTCISLQSQPSIWHHYQLDTNIYQTKYRN